MRTQILLAAALVCAVLVCAAPVRAQNGIATGAPLPQLSPAQVDEKVLSAPISLHLHDVALSAALEELQRQSGVALDLTLDRDVEPTLLDRTLVLDLETRHFDEAFAALMKAAKLSGVVLTRRLSSEPWRLSVGKIRSDAKLPQSVNGPFVMRLSTLETNLVASKKLDLHDPEKLVSNDQSRMIIEVKAVADKRLEVFDFVRAGVARAEDEQGRSLLLDNAIRDDAYLFTTVGDDAQVTLRFQAPAPDAQKLAHLEGTLSYRLITKSQRWEVPDLLAAPQWERDFSSNGEIFHLVVKATSLAANKAEVTLEVNLPPSLQGAALKNAPFLGGIYRRIQVQDANGLMLRSTGNSFNAEFSKSTYRAIYIPNVSPFVKENQDKTLALPLKFVLDTPTEFVETQVPFAFENVPLP